MTKSASQSYMMFALLLAIPIGYSSRNCLVQNSTMESWNKPSDYQWLFWGYSPANQLLQRQCFAPPLLSAFPPAVPVAPQWCVPPGRETLGEAVGWFGWRVVVEYAIPWDSQIKTAIIVIKKTIGIPPWVPKIYSHKRSARGMFSPEQERSAWEFQTLKKHQKTIHFFWRCHFWAQNQQLGDQVAKLREKASNYRGID